ALTMFVWCFDNVCGVLQYLCGALMIFVWYLAWCLDSVCVVPYLDSVHVVYLSGVITVFV
ncbi:16621_t:CDS:1, partial [Gigaspora rosea]